MSVVSVCGECACVLEQVWECVELTANELRIERAMLMSVCA